jgi:hypothetical protein
MGSRESAGRMRAIPALLMVLAVQGAAWRAPGKDPGRLATHRSRRTPA